MLGIGWTELFFIALILLLFVGPKNLPIFIGRVSRLVAQFKAASNDLRNQIDIEIAEITETGKELKADIVERTNAMYAEAEKAKEELDKVRQEIKNIEENEEEFLEKENESGDNQ